MWPAAIALNYSVENIRNDIRQKIIKFQFDSLVWGSLTLAPINERTSRTVSQSQTLSVYVCNSCFMRLLKVKVTTLRECKILMSAVNK